MKLPILSLKFFAVVMPAALLFCDVVQAACNATVNNRPMTLQECALTIQVYGQVIPGNYLVDNMGNWVNANNPAHRGNTFQDAQRNRHKRNHLNNGGTWRGQNFYQSPNTVYDASGGCEGGSCVNIID